MLSHLFILLAILSITYGRSTANALSFSNVVKTTGLEASFQLKTGPNQDSEDGISTNGISTNGTNEHGNTNDDKKIEAEVKTLKTDLGLNTASIKTLNAETKTLKTDLGTNTVSIKTLNAETKTLKTDLGTNTASIKTLNDQMQTLNSDLEKQIRSCMDVREVNGNTKDGIYQIQPSISLQPFYVHCRFSGNTSITAIGHDTEAITNVPPCEPIKCYSKKINYEVTMPQMKALIDNLGTCRQYVKYDCHGSRIEFAGWETWNGTMRHYWGGAGGREGFCACGVEGNCADRNQKCNCDKNDSVWRDDSGYLTQQNDLPVSALYFGDTDASVEMARYTLGRLECVVVGQ